MALPWKFLSEPGWPIRAVGSVRVGVSEVVVRVTVQDTYEADLDFTHDGMPYTFNISEWSKRKLKTYLEQFHAHQSRDQDIYGCFGVGGEYVGDLTHKANCIVHGCFDIMRFLHTLVQKQKKCVLSYAVDYVDHAPSVVRSYSKFVSLKTCELIERYHFTEDGGEFEVVEFIG